MVVARARGVGAVTMVVVVGTATQPLGPGTLKDGEGKGQLRRLQGRGGRNMGVNGEGLIPSKGTHFWSSISVVLGVSCLGAAGGRNLFREWMGTGGLEMINADNFFQNFSVKRKEQRMIDFLF